MTPTLHTHILARGPLAVATWPGSSARVLAVHGLSSNNRLWAWLADQAPQVHLIAPDLAGRGDSPPMAGRSSMAAHAEHLVELMDELGIDRIDLLGMSMGSFVVTALAARHPDRVRSVTLIDGGLPMTVTPDREVMADQLRAQYTDCRDWTSAAAYAVEYARTAAPLVAPGDHRLVGLLAHQLEHGNSGGRNRMHVPTVVDDGLDIFCTDSAGRHLAAVTAPIRLVWAPWSIGPDSPPMYSTEHVRRCVNEQPAIRSAELVAEVDHAGIVMTAPGALACARVLERNLG